MTMSDPDPAEVDGRPDAVGNAHTTVPVPLDHSVPAYRVALVSVGIAFTLTGLYTGAELATALGLEVAVRAIVLGSLILTVMSVPASVVGARTRLSTYMIVSHVFGQRGANLINLMLAVVLLGWYAVTAALFGRTFYLAAADMLPVHLPQWFYTVASSIVVCATTVFGFRAIDRLSLAAAPLLVALTAYVAWRALQHTTLAAMAAIPGLQVDLNTGISAVVGGMIVNVVLMPDVTRYSRSLIDCIVISFAGNGVGGAAALVLALLPVLAFHETDPMKYMAVLGLVTVAFSVLVISTWTINAVNLYSAGLVASTAFRRVGYGRLVVACGTVGTVLALTGLADRLIDFLIVLGLIVPPIAAVYITDFFIFGRRDYASPGEGPAARTNVSGLLACLLGALVGIVLYRTGISPTGVPTIESFLSAVAAYWGLEIGRLRVGRDRSWHAGAGVR
jgi:cytosine permease